jgi:hypothetical protein
MKMYPNNQMPAMVHPSNAMFQYVEKKFWDWIESQRAETKEMYFSDDAIYDKKGAIVGAIEAALEEANEEQKPVDMAKFDYDAVFS